MRTTTATCRCSTSCSARSAIRATSRPSKASGKEPRRGCRRCWRSGILRGSEPVPGYSWRSEEHTSELQSLMRISYAVFCLKKKTKTHNNMQLYKHHHIDNHA